MLIISIQGNIFTENIKTVSKIFEEDKPIINYHYSTTITISYEYECYFYIDRKIKISETTDIWSLSDGESFNETGGLTKKGKIEFKKRKAKKKRKLSKIRNRIIDEIISVKKEKS